MSPDYSKQRRALISLSVAYEGARDFTRRVLQTAFGDPPPDKCEWPPAAITPTEAHSRLKSVQRFLQQTEDVFQKVLRDIRDAQVALVASGFDASRSWIITDPLDKIRGGYLGACGVNRIVESAATEDSALKKVLKEIAVDLVLLEGRIAEVDHAAPPDAQPNEGEGKGGVGSAKTKKRRRRKPDPKVVERRAQRARQAKIDKQIFSDWRGQVWEEYKDYVAWKNENLPDGWPKLDRRYIALAIGREKARLKRCGKWPPK